MKPVRLGCIGLGIRGKLLLETALLFDDVQITAVYDPDPICTAQARILVERLSGETPRCYSEPDGWKRLCALKSVDAVLIASPWDQHARQAIAAMTAGKYVGLEVPACLTLDEGWALIETGEQTGGKCMLLENVNYFRNILAVQRMVDEGLFGTVQHALVGYQHDIRDLAFTPDGRLTWRGELMARLNGNLYPTHPIGPAARWLSIHRGDRFVRLSSMSTAARCMKEYARERFGADHPLAQRDYALGDTNTTLLETANGATVTLYFDVSSPRPPEFIWRLQGTRGAYDGNRGVYLEGVSPERSWEPFDAYQTRYESALWRELGDDAIQYGGHGGCDYILMHAFLQAVRNGDAPPIDIVDAVAWSAIIPLSQQSVAAHGASVDFPDFTRGRWRETRPGGI